MSTQSTQVWPAATPADLLAVKERVYDPAGFVCSGLSAEVEGAAYGAHEYRLDGSVVRARVAKVTPTKSGLFVTVWKRLGNGPIQPFDQGDGIDFLVVTAREDVHFGHFVFPAEVLVRQGVLASPGREGKRAFRVYPPWSVTGSSPAARTAAWQRPHFLPMEGAGAVHGQRARDLYSGSRTGRRESARDLQTDT